ncbi:MAG: hypothetical protein AB1776_07615 [Bacillota bacterium]
MADATGRKLVVLVLLAVSAALAVLPGGCTSGETRALESENARLRQRVAALEEKVRRLEAELAPLQRPLTINHRTYPAKQRFVEKETPLLAMPREGSVVLRDILPRSVVKVLDAADSDGELWLYVEVPVYDSPSNMKGWIREADSVPLTEENRKLVQSDVTVRAGTRVYEVFEFAKIASTPPGQALARREGEAGGETGRLRANLLSRRAGLLGGRAVCGLPAGGLKRSGEGRTELGASKKEASPSATMRAESPGSWKLSLREGI